jgi:hypothetical protein
MTKFRRLGRDPARPMLGHDPAYDVVSLGYSWCRRLSVIVRSKAER